MALLSPEIQDSKYTHERTQSTSINLLSTDEDLAWQSDYILSIVPPRDAAATAKRIISAIKDKPKERENPLYFLDLNALSPRSAASIASLFDSSPIRFIDGGIIGGAPTQSNPSDPTSAWSYRPSIPASGPHALQDAPVSGGKLATVLNMRHIAPTIGSASGLKMCFASMNKGFCAIAIQAFTTANTLGVLPELQSHLKEYSPKTGELADRALVGMPPKAYRWVHEMVEIANTFSDEGGFDKNIFLGASAVYKTVAEDTLLGEEKTGNRKRGRTVEDVAELMVEGMTKKKKKAE